MILVLYTRASDSCLMLDYLPVINFLLLLLLIIIILLFSAATSARQRLSTTDAIIHCGSDENARLPSSKLLLHVPLPHIISR